jgi:signal-transduction protein with cAMP-binding, CBS, and nucleotidyltransferase domain
MEQEFCAMHCKHPQYIAGASYVTYMHQDYADKKAGDVAEKDVLVLDGSTYIAYAAKAMRDAGVSSVLVGRYEKLAGIVTEKDILYRVVAEHRSPFKTVLKDVMSSPLITIDESVSVKDAIVLMRKNGIRRMPVTKNGEIVGLLTLRSIIGNSRERSIELAEVELPGAKNEIACPYCLSKFESKEDLSKHMDRLHLGSGLLEGDLRQR